MARMFERKDPRVFKITPRYWDPEKEERELREKKIKAELNIPEENGDVYIPNLKGRFKEIYNKRKENRKGNGKYAIRLFLVLILIFMAGFLLMSKYSEEIIRFLGN